MHWISVVQDGGKRRAFVKKAMNCEFPLNAGNSSTSSGTSAIQEELFCVVTVVSSLVIVNKFGTQLLQWHCTA